MASPTIDRNTVKSVLISFGERRREVTFSGGVESLYAQTNHVFGDVLQEKRINVLQLKNEEWEGQFVDIKQETVVPDKSVLRAFVEQDSEKTVSIDSLFLMCVYLKKTDTARID